MRCFRVVAGACSGTMSAANAYIADISSPKERPALMSHVGTLVQVASRLIDVHTPRGGVVVVFSPV